MATPSVKKSASTKIIASFDVFNGVLTWTFVNGDALEFDSYKTACVGPDMPEIGRRAIEHGFKQRISDAGAMSRDQTTGLSPEPSERIAKMRRVAEQLATGVWELERKGGTGGGDTVLIRALSEVFGKPLDVIRPWLKAKSTDERNALRADKKVAKVIARMEAEAAKGTDTSGLLAELGALGESA